MANRTWRRASDVEYEEEAETRKGPWTVEEDMRLIGHIRLHGEGRWSFLAKAAGLKRTGRSCRRRWVNGLRPDLKRDKISPEEERLIMQLHGRLGNRWSDIARCLPGRTDNGIKNYWRTRIKRKLNLQVESSSGCMDAENLVHFERSKGFCCFPTSSQTTADIHNTACNTEPSTSVPAQNADTPVQKNPNSRVQDDILPQVIPSTEGNCESELKEEIHGPQINGDGQGGGALQEHFEGSHDQLFEDMLPYNLSVGSLLSLLYSSEFYADGVIEYAQIPASSYMVASREAFSDTEAYLNRYSDVLWNMDKEDDWFNGSKHSTSSSERP